MNDIPILCFTRAALPAAWLPEEGAVPLSWEALLARLTAKRLSCWLPRRQAEDDPRWKQPIPYVLIQAPDGRLAAYPRQGREARLHGLWSLGIGGHVERCDEHDDLGDTLLACARREVIEELGLAPRGLRFLGLINEERSEVGQVHWGLVFQAGVDDAPHETPELGPLQWLPPTAIDHPLELWSRLALDLYRKLADPSSSASFALAFTNHCQEQS